MSGALARLRSHFQDELLVSVGRRMVRTPLGDELVEPVRDLLLQVRGTLESRSGFDPTTSTRHLTIAASDYVIADPDGRRTPAGAVRGAPHHVRSPPARAARGRGAGQRRARLPDRAGRALSSRRMRARSCSRTRSRAWPGPATRAVGATMSPEEYLNLGHVVVNVGERPGREYRRDLSPQDQAPAPRGDLDAQLLPGAPARGGNRPHRDDYDQAGVEYTPRSCRSSSCRLPIEIPAWWKCCTGIAPTIRTPRTSGSGRVLKEAVAALPSTPAHAAALAPARRLISTRGEPDCHVARRCRPAPAIGRGDARYRDKRFLPPPPARA